MSHLGRSVPLILVAFLYVLVPAIARAEGVAEVGAPPRTCEEYELAPDGSRRQTFDDVQVNGQIAGTPPRIVTDLDRGERATFCVAFQNRTGSTIDLEISTENVGADEKGLPATVDESAKYGASTWLKPRTKLVKDLRQGDRAWVEFDAVVPSDAVTGSSYAGIVAVGNAKAEVAGNQVEAIPSLVLQVAFDVPGNVDLSGEIVDVRAPRVIWWDGAGVSDLPVLEKLRGLGIAPIRFKWRNEGNVTNVISGEVPIKSELGGRTVTRLPIKDRVVLRGATIDMETTWSQDIPLIGRFTPTIKVTDRSGVTKTKQLDPIWVIPAWWYLLLLAIAIAIPISMRRRSKRRYRALVARVEAAEAEIERESDHPGEWDASDEDW